MYRMARRKAGRGISERNTLFIFHITGDKSGYVLVHTYIGARMMAVGEERQFKGEVEYLDEVSVE